MAKRQRCETCRKFKGIDKFQSKNKKLTYKICQPCKSEKGKKDSIRGKANEYLALGALLPAYPNTMMSSNEQTAHDLIIHLEKNKDVRVQVKTVSEKNTISFMGGKRSGGDRQYISSVKEYRYSAKDTDLVIGVRGLSMGNFELFFIPSLVIDKIGQKSMSANKVEFTKNDLSIIKRCKGPDFAEVFLKQLGK
ncbi:MAG: hypothetical protein P8N43_01560 [Alphaproteobacteria bacterium]|nr:hypothetical protein [Alphaproteobacteria bacterium]